MKNWESQILENWKIEMKSWKIEKSKTRNIEKLENWKLKIEEVKKLSEKLELNKWKIEKSEYRNIGKWEKLDK